MHAGIIQYKNCFFLNLERKFFQIFQHKLSPYILLCHSPKVFTFSVDEAQAVNAISPFRRNRYIFFWKLPTIGNVSFATNMRLVTIIKINITLLAQLFQIRKHCYLMIVIIGIWLSFGPKPYSFIFSTKTFKKRRTVLLLTDFPLSASHSALAVCKRCRWDFTEANKESLSASVSNGLRPCPDLLSNPEIPSDLKRLTQLLTLMWLMSVIMPTSLELRPSAFNRMTWQRLRKQWLSPNLKPASKSERSEAVSSGVLTRPMPAKIRNNIN